MNRIVLRLLGSLGAFALPVVALAQPAGDTILPGGPTTLNLLGTISSIFGILIPILVTFAVIWVIVGVIKYATGKDDEAKNEGRKTMIHGIIALFVIVSIWGLVAILNQTFGIGQGGSNVGTCQPIWDPNIGLSGDFVVPPQCEP